MPPPRPRCRSSIRSAYEPGVVDLLFGLLCDVARRHEPEVELALRGQSLPDTVPRAVWRRSLQAQGIWFQLLAIAEQNRAMRRRREIERERGYGQLRGTFADVFAEAARSRASPPRRCARC